jgi:hypothetical protein
LEEVSASEEEPVLQREADPENEPSIERQSSQEEVSFMEEEIPLFEEQAQASEGEGIFSRLAEILRVLPEKVSEIFEKILDCFLKLVNLPPSLSWSIEDRVTRIERKAEALFRKISPFLDENARHVYGCILAQLRYLFRKYRAREIRGHLLLGTGQPDLTGILIGAIELLLPYSAEKYALEADFYNKVFKTDTFMEGEIRLYTLPAVLIHLLSDREVRTFIGKILHSVRQEKPEERPVSRRADDSNNSSSA